MRDIHLLLRNTANKLPVPPKLIPELFPGIELQALALTPWM
jgi:hypothetical protein